MLRPLTSLRFFAALLVFAFHSPGLNPWAGLLSLGYAGVGFFFILSGFILILTYREAFDGELRWTACQSFYAARIARVYPLHVVALVLMLVVLVTLGAAYWSPLDPGTHLRQIALQALLLQSWTSNVTMFTGANPPSWSISDEAFFYACFPFIAWVSLRYLRRAGQRELITAAGALMTGFFLVTCKIATTTEWPLYAFPPIRLLDFTVGVLLGLAFLSRARGARPQLLRPTSIELCAVGGVALAIVFSAWLPLSLRFAAWLMPWWGFLISVFARQAGALSRALSHPIFVRLGEISFAFYLVHLAVIETFRATVGTAGLPMTLASLAVTIALSFVLNSLVEQPMRVRLRRALTPSLQPASSAA